MKKIAIFVSGDPAATRRVISLFNEGNRIRVEAVIADSPATLEEISKIDSSVMLFSKEEWKEGKEGVLNSLIEKGVDKIALENWVEPESEETDENSFGNLDSFNISSEEEAPREVVAVFKEESHPAIPTPKEPVSIDEEWARTLKIDYNENNLREVPPPIPGTQSSSSAPVYAQPTTPTPNNPQAAEKNQEKMPPSYLVWSVVITVLCCMIPGIVAIIYSSQVSTKYYSGDIEGAKRSSENAQIWIIVSFVLGVLSSTLYLPIALIN